MKSAYRFNAYPKSVKRSQLGKDKGEINIKVYRNLMVEPRVIRGNTYSKNYYKNIQEDEFT